MNLQEQHAVLVLAASCSTGDPANYRVSLKELSLGSYCNIPCRAHTRRHLAVNRVRNTARMLCEGYDHGLVDPADLPSTTLSLLEQNTFQVRRCCLRLQLMMWVKYTYIHTNQYTTEERKAYHRPTG